MQDATTTIAREWLEEGTELAHTSPTDRSPVAVWVTHPKDPQRFRALTFLGRAGISNCVFGRTGKLAP